jgi:hypothetical protein
MIEIILGIILSLVYGSGVVFAMKLLWVAWIGHYRVSRIIFGVKNELVAANCIQYMNQFADITDVYVFTMATSRSLFNLSPIYYRWSMTSNGICLDRVTTVVDYSGRSETPTKKYMADNFRDFDVSTNFFLPSRVLLTPYNHKRLQSAMDEIFVLTKMST